MRIVVLSFDPVTAVGGVEGRARSYLKHLLELGHTVRLYDLSRPARKEAITIHEATITFLSPSPQHTFVTLGMIIRDIFSNRPDAIFILSGTGTSIGIATLVLARLLRIKSGVFIYGKDILTARMHLIQLWMLRIGLAIAKQIGVNSIATARLLPVSAKQISLLYPGVEPSITEGFDRASFDSKTILFVGRLVHRKGADDLIKAFNILVKQIQDTSLEIVGDGPERVSLEKLSISLGIKDRVHFLGTLTGDDLYRRYARCTVFCMPSKSLRDDVEGFGTVFIEAALFGKPSVATRSGGMPEAVVDGETGILVDEGDAEEICGALLRLLEDKDLAKRLGANGRKRALSEFTSQIATERLLKMFD